VKLTRREIHLLIILALTFPILIVTKFETIIENELTWLIFYVAPLGFYIATDSERKGWDK
jgi:hypothetical protein